MPTLRHALALCAPFMLGALLIPGCSADGGDGTGDEDIAVHGMTYEEFKAQAYQEADTGVWIVNGDIPVAEERDLKDFYLRNIQKDALAIATSGGVDVKWDDTKKLNITYCVSTGFGNNHSKMVAAMNSATAAWEAVANVNFVHMSDQDSVCTASNSKVIFDVRQVQGQQYLARAFFPNQSRSTRNVLVDTSSFGNIGAITLEGVLRHELGHVLGFRHEHTRPEAGKCYEDANYRGVTPYDSNSVMHYPQCNGTNTGDLILTEKDKQGAAAIYGAPGGNPPPPPAPGTCAHSKCATGSTLASDCDPCVAKIAAADPYCVQTKWDATCVGEVKSVCGESCTAQPAPAPCAHDKCTTGAKLSTGCDACVDKIIKADPYCGTTGWDGVCVGQVKSVCALSCQ